MEHKKIQTKTKKLLKIKIKIKQNFTKSPAIAGARNSRFNLSDPNL